MSASVGPGSKSTLEGQADSVEIVRARAEHAPVALMQLDGNSHCVWVSASFCTLTGLTAAEAEGTGWERALHLEDRDFVLAQWRAASADEPLALELRLQRADGSERHVLGQLGVLRGTAGERLGALLALTDISKRVAADRKYHLLFEQSSEPNLFLDENGVVRGCNRATLQLLRAPQEQDVIGKSLFALSPELQPDGRSSLEKGRAAHATCRLRGSHRFAWVHAAVDGTEVPVEVAMSCLLVEGRRGFLVTEHDQTDRLAAQRAIERSREAAVEALRTKSQFLANMSHEIRTPMNGVLGMLQLVLDMRLDREQRDLLTTAHDSAVGLLAILDDILDLSKLEAGRLSVETVPFALDAVLRETLRVLALRAHAKHLELVLELDRDVPLQVCGDPLRLRQVLTNLLGNAIKFTERGAVVLAVFRAVGEGGEAQIGFQVRDSGIGMSPESLDKVFEPFAQADGSTTRRFGGTGLGLTITRDLVGLMGGALQVRSALGVGSIFSFELPLRGQEGVAEEAPPGHGEPILIVDDDAAARHGIALLVERLGFSAMAVASLDEAAARIRSGATAYRAALVDDGLRRDDEGAVFDAHLAALAASAQQVLLLHAHDATRAGTQPPSAHAAAMLLKPVLPHDLRLALCAPPDEAASHAPSNVGAAVPPLRVLLVEDHPVNTHFVTVLLTRRGHCVAHAEDGARSVAMFQAEPFDLILMDVQMPVMDGLEATRQIRALEAERGGRIPIIGLSAHAMHEEAQRCVAAGMDRYLAKPLRAEALWTVLAELFASAPPPTARPSTAPVVHAADGTPPFDAPALYERACSETDFMLELLNLYCKSEQEMIDAVAESVTAGDLQALRASAHRLGGALKMICADPAATLATQLEHAGRYGRAAEVRALHGALLRELARLGPSLRAFIAARGVGGLVRETP